MLLQLQRYETMRENNRDRLYFMIFFNINRVFFNNCQFISISDLPSSENEIDNRQRSNS